MIYATIPDRTQWNGKALRQGEAETAKSTSTYTTVATPAKRYVQLLLAAVRGWEVAKGGRCLLIMLLLLLLLSYTLVHILVYTHMYIRYRMVLCSFVLSAVGSILVVVDTAVVSVAAITTGKSKKKKWFCNGSVPQVLPASEFQYLRVPVISAFGTPGIGEYPVISPVGTPGTRY